MRLNKIGWVALLFLSCQNGPSEVKLKNINTAEVNNSLNKDGYYFLISCLRCSCFNTRLKELKPEELDALKDYVWIADTNCTKLPYPVQHMDQKKLDALSPEIYNIVLMKKTSGTVETRLISTEENEELVTISKDFLKGKSR